ncbi:dd7a5ccc-ea38-472b-ab92-db7e41419cec-CDS [Sclerotinia trifoliorum]|uniref:Dd7a5ccc-ea38-472b-ab92-db7e41419cec-CDS n=1 Tax=Sclerotinia trifoliorum TaxID=28548 RepID=A0A8H2VQA1_9HELO|nr:dd7a5ccc-ea38-472b-ab92-db7e41419cec-CDS [Sclerotinia trifoliorum]
MFENFTFGAAPTNPYQYDDDVQLSPRDDSYPIPISPSDNSYPFFDDYKPSTPLDDIIDQFHHQSLSYEEARNFQSRQYASPTPSLSGDSEISSSSSDSTHSVPSTPTSPYRAGVLACRRLQRQVNVQLQCSTSHIRDISSLVEDMLSNNSQCNLHPSPSKTTLASSPMSTMVVDPCTQNEWNDSESEKARRRWLNIVVNDIDVDELYMEGDHWDREDACLSLRRASTPIGIKKLGLRCKTSLDCVGGVRMKVARGPRMKMRMGKVGRVVE